MPNFTSPIPLSLYIHFPWCVRKCPYCDFNSHEIRNSIPEKDYLAALIKNLDEQLPSIWGRRLSSIFMGGGTPSLFSAESIEKLLMAINARLPFNQDLEITLEANPGTIDEQHFIGYRQAGINRLSIGIQSLQNEKLKILGRIHTRDHALRAIEIAQKSGFLNFNIDLMHGLPQQSVDDALADLQDVIDCQPTHLSWYQLTIEPNTFFHHQPPLLPPEEKLCDIQEAGKKLLTQNGYVQYEVSAYAKKNLQCLHNRNYWEFGDYLGIGAGAHSKITRLDQQQVIRHSQFKNPKDFINQTNSGNHTIVAEKDLVFEFMLNALRLTNGFPKTLFNERTGLSLSSITELLTSAKEKKLLEENEHNLQPTAKGQQFLNDLIAIFLP